MPPVRVLFAAVPVVLLLLAGCSQEDSALPYTVPAPGGVATEELAADQTRSMAVQGEASDVVPSERQVIQNGSVMLTVKDPVGTSAKVVDLLETHGDDVRIEQRSEQDYGDGSSSAWLVVRVPADEVSGIITELGDLGTVTSVELTSQDVTAAAEDLDARISAQQISVARMEDVLSRAQTTTDVVAAEDALRQRQGDLEAMVAERARIADQVALSSLSITLSETSVVAAEGPTTFGDAVRSGWSSMVHAGRTTVLVFGVLLPWLVLAGLITTVIVQVIRRSLRQRRARRAVPDTTVNQVPEHEPQRG